MAFFQDKYSSTGREESKVEEPVDPNAFNVKITKKGDGKEIPHGSTITVHYTGKLVDGSVFDSSVTRNQPFVFKLGAGQVIKCWDEGYKQLTVGAEAILTCPPDYAYGSRGAGGVIPPNAKLTFEVSVISYK